LGRFHIRLHLWGVSRGGPSVVGRDWSPVSSNKARGYCCRGNSRRQQPSPTHSRWQMGPTHYSPAGVLFAHTPYVAQREPTPGGLAVPGSAACAQAASASHASCRSSSACVVRGQTCAGARAASASHASCRSGSGNTSSDASCRPGAIGAPWFCTGGGRPQAPRVPAGKCI
jgi:hypothetical protein